MVEEREGGGEGRREGGEKKGRSGGRKWDEEGKMAEKGREEVGLGRQAGPCVPPEAVSLSLSLCTVAEIRGTRKYHTTT